MCSVYSFIYVRLPAASVSKEMICTRENRVAWDRSKPDLPFYSPLRILLTVLRKLSGALRRRKLHVLIFFQILS